MHEEHLLDLSCMSWISSTLCDHWQTLNACITEGEQIEAATVLNILNGILNAVVQSSYEIERLHLEPEDAAPLGRAMDALTRLYLAYHRQYIREQSSELQTDDQKLLQSKAEETDLYGEVLACLKSVPQAWRLRQSEAEIQQLKTSLEGCQEENARLLTLSNQSGNVQDLKNRIKELEAALAAQPVTPTPDLNAITNLEAHIKTLEAELAAQKTAAQTAAQLAADRIKRLEEELAAARTTPAADPTPVPVLNPETNPDPIPVLNPETDPEPTPVSQPDADTFHPDTVTGGICTVEACGGKTKLGTPLPAIRDQIEYLDLTLCDANEIADEAFRGCPNLKHVVLPLSMIIGTASFADCPKLEEIYLEYAPRIGDRAFHSCPSLQKVHFTSRRTEIGIDAFALCPNVAFRCRKNSSAAAYAAEHGFDIF